MTILGTLLVKMALDAAGFRQDMAGSAQAFADAGRRIGQAGIDLAPVSVPILALGRSALSSAAEFESGMNVFRATSGATAAQMDDMRVIATQLGADMQLPGTSAADAAEAMIALGQRGLEVNEVFDAARGVLQLSAAGQLSNARAAELTASALNAFKMAGSEAANVANLMAAGSTSSGTSIEHMGQAMQASAAVFAAAGVPIEQLVTSIGMMAKAGIQGSDAGTSLKTMLLSLQAPSGTAAAAMEKLGINVYDAQGSMLSFPQIIDQFSRASAGLSEAQRNAAMTTIFGTDAIRAANVVMLQGVGAFTEMEAASTRQNVAAELAAARMQGLEGAVEGFRSSMETTLMNAVMPFLPQLASLVQSAGEFVGRLGEANPALTNAGVAVAGVLAVAGPLLMLVGPLTAAFAVLTGPIGLIVLGIAALAAAFASGAITIDSIRPVLDAVGQALNFVKGIVEQVFAAIQGIITGAMQVIRGDISGGMETIRNAFSTAWTNISTQLGTVLQTIITYVQQNLPVWIARLSEWATAAWEWLVAAVPPMLAELGNFVRGLLEELGAKLPGWIAAFLDWAGEAVEWLADAIPPLVTQLGQFVSRMISELGAKLPGWITAFLNWAAEAVAWVAKAIPPLLVELGKFLAAAVTWIIGTAVPALIRQTIKLAGALIGWVVKDLLPQVVPELTKFLTAVVVFLVDMVAAVATAAWEIGKGIVLGIRKGIEDLWDEFREWVGGLITAVINWLKGLMGIESPSRVMAEEVGRPLVEGIIVGAQAAAPAATAALGHTLQGVVAGSIRDLAAGVGPVADAIRTAVDAINAIQSVVVVDVRAKMAYIAERIVGMAFHLARVADWMSADARAAAAKFAEGAKPVIDLIRSAADAVNSVQSVVVVDVRAKMAYIAERIVGMAFHLARVADWMSADARAAAARFAEGAKPVVDIIKAAVDAVNGVQSVVIVDVRERMAYIAERIVGMVFHLARVADWIGVEAQGAAIAFASAVGPVVEIIKSAVETINAVQGIEIVDVRERMAYIAERIVGMVFHLARVADWIGVEAQGAAIAFASAVGPVIAAIKSAIETINALQEVDADAGTGAVIGYLAQTMVGIIAMLRDVRTRAGDIAGLLDFSERAQSIMTAVTDAIATLKAISELEAPAAAEVVAKVWAEMREIMEIIANSLSWRVVRLDAGTLVSGALSMGSSWLLALVAGIWAAMPELEAVLAYIAGLFPHSPAEHGPLRRAPNWSAYMLSGLDRAGETLARRLGAAMPAGALVPVRAGAGGATGARAKSSVTININNPRGETSEQSLRRQLMLLSQLGMVEL